MSLNDSMLRNEPVHYRTLIFSLSLIDYITNMVLEFVSVSVRQCSGGSGEMLALSKLPQRSR